MYHSVGRVMHDWAWSNLTVPASIFEDHLRWLARAGYRSVDLNDLREHVSGRDVIRDRAVVLTFDDGYVDNWTYAAPLLEKYGFKGTILVTPEFVHPVPVIRPTLRDVWDGKARRAELEVRGFMSWAELRAASDAGVLSVQSHAMTHTWYPTSEKVIDFHHPGDNYYWLDWNAFPEDKPYYLQHLGESRVPFGVPVYEHKKSLEATRRYFPLPEESSSLAAFVAESGGTGFFARSDWRDVLFAQLETARAQVPHLGRYETVEERDARIELELVTSRKLTEQSVGKPVDFHVWPGGGYDEHAMRVARDLFKAVTVGPKDRVGLANRPGEDEGTIVRRGIPALAHGDVTHYLGGRYLVAFMEEFKSSPLARRRRQFLKLGYLLGARTGLWKAREV